MVYVFVLYVSVECYCSVSRRRLQVITVNSIITVENGRLGNLKKTQGNSFLKKNYKFVFGGVIVRLVGKTSHSSRDSDTCLYVDLLLHEWVVSPACRCSADVCSD